MSTFSNPEIQKKDQRNIEKTIGSVKELLTKHCVLKTEINKNGEDMKGKFGRVLGDFVAADGRMITDILIEEGYAVAYHGQSKDDIQEAHLANRQKLLQEGIILQSDIDKVSKK